MPASPKATRSAAGRRELSLELARELENPGGARLPSNHPEPVAEAGQDRHPGDLGPLEGDAAPGSFRVDPGRLRDGQAGNEGSDLAHGSNRCVRSFPVGWAPPTTEFKTRQGFGDGGRCPPYGRTPLPPSSPHEPQIYVAIGYTTEEAISLGYLPYRIAVADHRVPEADREKVEAALIELGAVEASEGAPTPL